MMKTLKNIGEKKINIALDGPAGSGKSTVARILAADYGILYLDTGAMYRAFALGLLRKNINPKDGEAAQSAAAGVPVRVKYVNGEQRTYLGDEDVSEEIRRNEVSRAASDVAVHRKVRERLVEMQREIAGRMSCVLDGRDVGSYVLPHADYKFYVTADSRVRAKRRYLELLARGQEADERKIYEQILSRDKQDKGREFAPLKKADDAIEIDTSDKSIEEVVREIERIVDEKL
ncbi:MAG: (d)CMP kinase [Candidatus Borkfalkiaceae bacterium]|nr:(d)CMP kinase [Clostridia bacterium]MDY6223075.1 (d)CMP kinase [Christensenellaceae bacterium]